MGIDERQHGAGIWATMVLVTICSRWANQVFTVSPIICRICSGTVLFASSSP